MESPNGSSSALTQSIRTKMHTSLNSLMMSHTLLSLLIPLFISLFYFSAPDSRRKPIFLLNVGAIILAFIVCVLVDVSAIHTTLHPLNQWHLNIPTQFIVVWQSILVDLTLLVRLISTYPAEQIGPTGFALLVSTPILLKLARAINLLLFTKVMVDTLYGPNAAMADIAFVSKPYIKTEWGVQMMDNIYVSLAFLWSTRSQGKKKVIPEARCVTQALAWRTRALLKSLFHISFTNFAMPTIFSIAQFVSIYHGIDMAILSQLVLVNMMLSTLGVVCATIWTCRLSRQEAQAEIILRSCHIASVAHLRYPVSTRNSETSDSSTKSEDLGH